MTHPADPLPWHRAERLSRADEITNALREKFGARCLAVGIYGSTGRGEDTEFSDLEMHCIVSEPDTYSEYLEWCEGRHKSSCDVLSAAHIRQRASKVEAEWAVGQGEFIHVLPTYDPAGFWPEIAERAQTISEKQINSALEEIIIGHLCEYVSKMRGTTDSSALPMLAFEVVRCGCWMIGLINRRPYRSVTRLIPDALALPDRPDGFDDLAGRILSGALAGGLNEDIERLWRGCLAVADMRRVPLRLSFAEELARLS